MRLTRRIPSNQKADVSTIHSDSSLQLPHSGLSLNIDVFLSEIIGFNFFGIKLFGRYIQNRLKRSIHSDWLLHGLLLALMSTTSIRNIWAIYLKLSTITLISDFFGTISLANWLCSSCSPEKFICQVFFKQICLRADLNLKVSQSCIISDICAKLSFEKVQFLITVLQSVEVHLSSSRFVPSLNDLYLICKFHNLGFHQRSSSVRLFSQICLSANACLES